MEVVVQLSTVGPCPALVDESLGISQRKAKDLYRRPNAVGLREPLGAKAYEDLLPSAALVPQLVGAPLTPLVTSQPA